MPDESMLHEKARAAVLNGQLPADPPARPQGGLGAGALGAVSERPVPLHEVASAVEFERAGRAAEPGTFFYWIVRRGTTGRFAALAAAFAKEPEVAILWDRRRGERRRPSHAAFSERRAAPPFTWITLDFLITTSAPTPLGSGPAVNVGHSRPSHAATHSRRTVRLLPPSAILRG